MSRLYVGVKNDFREVFRSKTTPTESTHPQYSYVIGAFRTNAGATFMAICGRNNPHCRCVNDAEKLAKKMKEDGFETYWLSALLPRLHSFTTQQVNVLKVLFQNTWRERDHVATSL